MLFRFVVSHTTSDVVRRAALAAILLGSLAPLAAQSTLYNGITLPSTFPPNRTPTQEYSLPSYLTNPPAVIPIDVGRQLFVDDFLIESTTLARTQHRPIMHPANPILRPGGPDTQDSAFPFSDGVWFDPADRLFKMWYYGDSGSNVSYAYSADGLVWTKPSLADAVVPNTNYVLQVPGGRDSDTIWMDLDDPNPARKFKAFVYVSPGVFSVHFSPDGIHWTARQPYNILTLSDRSTMFWNPFRKVWSASLRSRIFLPPTANRVGYTARARFYAESPDLTSWKPSDFISSYWTGPDDQDPPYAGPGGAFPELYTLDAVAYESLMVGLFSWYHPGPDRDPSYGPGPNLVELGVGFSRDGYQWVRPTRGFADTAFIRAANQTGAWDDKNTQSAGGVMLVVGDELWFYFSGRQEKPSNVGATGLAILRRDGFYSMDAGAAEGTLTTRPLRFSGSHMFVNVDAPAGQLKVEILDASGNPIAPFTKANSVAISSDSTLKEVTWSGASDLSSLAGRTVKIRFSLTSGKLYSFWITPSTAGASNGYVAAGGPGFTTSIDDKGTAIAQGTVATPSLTPAGGTFSNAPQVTIATSTAGAIIRYTTDGTEPSLGSPIYSLPLLIAQPSTLKAKAWKGGMNASATAAATYAFSPDSVAPTITITGLTSGQSIEGTVTLTVNTLDNIAVTGVQYQLDGQNLTAEVTTAPFSLIWNSRTNANGSHSLTAIARDAAGNRTTSAATSVTINNDLTPPAIAISGIVPGQTLAGRINLTATATDDRGVAGVQFKLDGVALESEILASPFGTAWLTSNTENGSHVLTAEARDAAGNRTTSAELPVTIYNAGTPPPGAAAILTFDSADVSGPTIQDRSGHRNDGTSVGATYTTGPLPAANQALHLDGATTEVAVPTGNAFDLVQDLTFSVWVKTTNTARSEAILSKFDPSNAEFGYLFYMNRTGRIGMHIGAFNIAGAADSPYDITTPTGINDGQWHHLVVVMQLNAGVTFYVDGRQTSTHSVPLKAEGNNRQFRIGINDYPPYGDHWTGDMDQLRIYTRALSAGEIAALNVEFANARRQGR